MNAEAAFSPTPNSRARRGLLSAVSATSGAALPVFLVGALAVQIRSHLHFGATRLGAAVAVYYAAAALSSIPFGRLVESVGGVRVMRASALSSAALMLVLAGTVGRWWSLTVVLAFAGMASSASQPAANQFISRTVAPQRQGTAFGIKQSAIPLASLLAGVAVPAIALTVGWRWAFVGAAGLACASALAVPKPSQSLRERRAERVASGVARPPIRPSLVVLAAAFAVGLLAASTLGTFLVASAVSSGIDKGAAGLVAALAALTSLVTRLVVGVRADQRGGRHFPVVAAMLALGSLGYCLLALGSAFSSAALFIPGAVAAFAAGWGWNGLFNFAVVRTNPEAPALATAVAQTGGRLGSVGGPLIFGLLVDHASYQAAWSLDAVFALAAAAAMILGRRLLVAERAGSAPAGAGPGTESEPGR